ncbi:MAG: hypothetical protein HYU39_05495 [Thaumarchaeota archaeon]|nr:hypothetical protein [Nitrososphaerota archaeon]
MLTIDDEFVLGRLPSLASMTIPSIDLTEANGRIELLRLTVNRTLAAFIHFFFEKRGWNPVTSDYWLYLSEPVELLESFILEGINPDICETLIPAFNPHLHFINYHPMYEPSSDFVPSQWYFQFVDSKVADEEGFLVLYGDPKETKFLEKKESPREEVDPSKITQVMLVLGFQSLQHEDLEDEDLRKGMDGIRFDTVGETNVDNLRKFCDTAGEHIILCRDLVCMKRVNNLLRATNLQATVFTLSELPSFCILEASQRESALAEWKNLTWRVTEEIRKMIGRPGLMKWDSEEAKTWLTNIRSTMKKVHSFLDSYRPEYYGDAIRNAGYAVEACLVMMYAQKRGKSLRIVPRWRLTASEILYDKGVYEELTSRFGASRLNSLKYIITQRNMYSHPGDQARKDIAEAVVTQAKGFVDEFLSQIEKQI